MTLTLREFFEYLILAALLLFVVVVFLRGLRGILRLKRERSNRIQCRLCGYKFYAQTSGKKRKNQAPFSCPHCGALN